MVLLLCKLEKKTSVRLGNILPQALWQGDGYTWRLYSTRQTRAA